MILRVRDLRVSFRTEQGLVRVLDGVSFDVAEGEVLGIAGESGSGKTMTVLAVMGLITDPNAVIEGSIQYRGRELVGMKSREMQIPPQAQVRLTEALQRLVQLYTAWERPDKAARWKQKLDAQADPKSPDAP